MDESGVEKVDRVVIFASTPYSGHQLYDQRLAKALMRAGREVLYVEPPVPIAVRGRAHADAQCRHREVRPDGMVVITPRIIPYGKRVLLAPLGGVLVGAQVRWFLGRLPRRPTAIVSTAAHPTTIRFFKRLRRIMVVKDDYVVGSDLTGLNPRLVQRQRRALLRLHDQVTVVSPTLAATLLREGARSLVVPAGCEPIQPDLGEPTILQDVPRPRAVFTGMLSDRIDFSLLREVTEAGMTLVIVGRRQPTFSEQPALEELKKSGKAYELGELDQESLNAVMTNCDIGLIPYTLSDFNKSSFPLKTFEYLSAGLPIVSTPLPSILWLDNIDIHLTALGSTGSEAISAALSAAQNPDVRARCRATGAGNTWSHRAENYLSLLESSETP